MLRAAALAACAVLISGCDWIALGANALRYRTIQSGEVANIAAADSLVYATKGNDGLVIVDGRSGEIVGTAQPPPGIESIDDLAVEAHLLFVLDARAPGWLAVFRVDDPRQPRLVSGPVPVAVGPFSGVSAANGLVIVSGGTSSLTAWSYDSAGTLRGPQASADLGRGQPDVTVASNGKMAFVSTHYRGPRFGIDVIAVDGAGGLGDAAEVPIAGAGFTAGGAKPANFPIETALLGRDTVLVAFARGLAIVDAADPRRPVLRRVVPLGGPAVNVDARDARAAVVVAGTNPAVVIVDFGDGAPRIVKRLPIPPGTFPTAVAFTGSRVAVAAGSRGVLLLDP